MSPRLDDYQIDTVHWYLTHDRAIDASEPGVGKSFPAIVAAQQSKSERPAHLLIVPAYLAYNWYDMLLAFEVPATAIAIVQGTPQQKKQAIESAATWTIASYHMLSLHPYADMLERRYWNTVIFDEAHRLKGRNSKWTKRAHRLHAARVWMLTGTPVVKGPDDVFPLLKLADPKRFTSYWRFVDEWCITRKTPWSTDVVGYKDKAAFERMLQPYMRRLLLRDVQPQIPEEVETLIPVEMPPRFQKAHQRAKDDYILALPNQETVDLESGGALVHALRRITAESDAKTDALFDLLQDLPAEPITVFTWYRESAHRTATQLAAKGYSVRVVTGEHSAQQRHEIATAYRNGEFQILVATLGSMREGNNLQHSSIIVFLEMAWTAADNAQAVARLKRRGQTETVRKYIIACRKSVDYSVYRAQRRRETQSLRAILLDLLAEEL